MPRLQGPTDPDEFRIWDDSYRNRLYIDPLPADSIASETEQSWYAISAFKKADATDWTNVLIKRIALTDETELKRIAGLDAEQRKAAIRAINNYELKVAAGRGTIIHYWCEDLLNGRDMRTITDMDLSIDKIPERSLAEAETYKAAILDFFETYQPELVATEYVAIHRDLNGVGYGGTPDGIWRLTKTKKGYFAFDYKSRAADTNHTVYPQEAAQVAAGVKAQYMVVSNGNGGAQREPFPDLDGGMVVSIKPDGARVYPIDLDTAFQHWTAVHNWSLQKKQERASIGRQWPAKRSTNNPARETIKADIYSAQSMDELKAIWRKHKDIWNDELTNAATQKKAQLQEAA